MHLQVLRFVERLVLRWFELDAVSKTCQISVMYYLSDTYAVDVLWSLVSCLLFILLSDTAAFLVMGLCYLSHAEVGLWPFL
jgi:hypothetical protein